MSRAHQLAAAFHGNLRPVSLHRNRTALIPSPPLALLDQRARLLSKDPEDRSVTNWNRHQCGTINPPTDNLLLRLPAIRCSLCQELNPTVFNWSMIGLVVKGVTIDTFIYDQGPFGTCAAHTVVVAMDTQRTIGGALHGHTVCQRLDVGDLLRRYYEEFGVPLGQWTDRLLVMMLVENLMRCAQADGVAYERPWLAPSQQFHQAVPRTLRIQSIFKVPSVQIDYIIRLLARGHALTAGVSTGRCFRFVQGGQIYCPVECQGDHLITLLGHGVGMRPEVLRDEAPLPSIAQNPANYRDRSSPRGPMIYYNARNTHGAEAHPDVAFEGSGGDFCVWADQLDGFVWGFYLADD